jgi:hypothetical protein
MRRIGWVSAVLILVGLAPMLGLALRSALVALAGCPPPEAPARGCRLAGVDLGGLLLALGDGARFFVLTAPLALAGILLGITLAILALLRRARD